MEDKKTNKGFTPASNKGLSAGEEQERPTRPAELVKIKFRAGRAAEGVTADADGFAFVDAEKAEYLIRINYADKAEEI